MRLRFRFKHFRWLALGVFVGVTLAAAQVLWTPDLRVARRRALSPKEFRSKAFGTVGIDKLPGLREMLVYPPEKTADGRMVQYVTGEVCVKRPRLPYAYEPFTFFAELPMAPPSSAPSAPASSTVQDFLGRGRTPQGFDGSGRVSYRYAWWALPRLIIGLWLGGCMLLIGGIVPAMVAFARSLRPSYRVSSIDGGGAVSLEASPPCDPDQLAAAVEQATAAGDSDEKIDAPVVPAQENSPRPIEHDAPIPAGAHEPKKSPEYEGEYYPVAKSSHAAEPGPADR